MKNSFNEPLDEAHLSEAAILLPGFPGYRTRNGRTGLDWVDTQYEIAHMAGVFVRNFATGSWRHTNNLSHPIVNFIVGLSCLSVIPVPNAEVIPVVFGIVLLGICIGMWEKLSTAIIKG